jgi:dynein heavy chain
MKDPNGNTFKNIDCDKKGKPTKATWPGCQIMMKEPEYFQKTLLNLKDQIDSNKVPKQNIKPVKAIMKDQPDSFILEKMILLSSAGAQLGQWVKNIVMYWDTVQIIVPLRKEVATTQAQLSAAQIKLDAVMAIVAELQKKLDIVQKKYDAAMKLKSDAEAEAKYYSDRLDLATRLLTALSSENARWGGIIEEIQNEVDVIVGNVLMAAAFISYIGPFSKTMRDELI